MRSGVLLGGKHFRPHWPWFLFVLAATAGASVWFFWESRGRADWPSGASAVGLTLGTLGGLICLFELLIWPRKMLRTWPLGKATLWMRAHIWLGLLAVPLLIYHSGFRLGGSLATTLMILFLVVIASGIYGLILQQYLPKRLLEDVPGETIYAQIENLMAYYAEEASWLVNATCGPRSDNEPEPGLKDGLARKVERRKGMLMTAKAVSQMPAVGRVGGAVILTTPTPETPVPRSDALRTFFEQTVEPFLLLGRKARSPLWPRKQSERMFDDVRARLRPEAHPALKTLEDLCEKRRQLDRQSRMHWWLHSWLSIHLPLSVALIVLMLVHIVVALWWY